METTKPNLEGGGDKLPVLALSFVALLALSGVANAKVEDVLKEGHNADRFNDIMELMQSRQDSKLNAIDPEDQKYLDNTVKVQVTYQNKKYNLVYKSGCKELSMREFRTDGGISNLSMHYESSGGDVAYFPDGVTSKGTNGVGTSTDFTNINGCIYPNIKEDPADREKTTKFLNEIYTQVMGKSL